MTTVTVDFGPIARCERCGDPVRWAFTERMLRRRVDPDPDVMDGHLILFRDGDGHLCAYHPANVSAAEVWPPTRDRWRWHRCVP